MFPFLAVLFCTVGVLLMIIISTTLSRTSGADAVVRPEPVSVTSLDLRELRLWPVYMECSAAGLQEIRADDPGVPRTWAAAEALALDGAWTSKLEWRGGVRATDLDLLELGIADWLHEQYLRRARQAVIFLVRPDGIDVFHAVFRLIGRLNRLETAAGENPLTVGYDALPSRGRILIQPLDGRPEVDIGAWESRPQ